VKTALAILGGLVAGAVAGGLVVSSSPCCTLVAQGVRAKFPAWAQTAGDAFNAWPSMVGLANFGSSS